MLKNLKESIRIISHEIKTINEDRNCTSIEIIQSEEQKEKQE